MITDFRGEHAFLSNFWMFPIEYEGILYPSTEHAYQAAKYYDRERKERIAAMPKPGQAKRAGQEPGIREDWRDVSIAVMREVCEIKFQDPVLRAKLDATKGEILVEGNTWGDTFWGICNGVGENWLGRILMEIRDGQGGGLEKF